ncbi:DUF305 domain-containing protein [Micromonospora chaiyaphumensis]|uniref:Uncharacterized conserved protein, DUF305 family n=1 Tax=Micromonospora chaiyaphumensis TaxID=307119 RepID=A0A1C4ZD48_9ACTN|nr:DUF305 domain-containing protein [Micromonospora chaiyaphumensis]SCF30864.1 Uncharacterized conserved protein, DUF305 family [Micromonospora chaiyaphumensis]
MPLSRRVIVSAVVATVAVGSGVGFAVWAGGDDPAYRPPSGHVVQPGAPGQPGRSLSGDDLAQVSPPGFKAADTLFIQGMIPHHAQALEMTALLPGRTTNPDVTLLAKRIDVSQRDEITRMQRWLAERSVPTTGPNAGHAGHELMPGMLTAAQLDQLKQARNGDFDRLFLTFMIRHHQGALSMVEELYASGGGVEPATDQFAREVNADQSIEIQRMQEMLAKMG